jgi:electron transport complex protein RnfG
MDDTNANTDAGDPAKSDWLRIYAVMIGLGILCSFAIVLTYELTREPILNNQAAFRGEAGLAVLPGAESIRVFHQDPDGRFVEGAGTTEGTELIFAGYDAGGRLVGLAIEAAGKGYQDVIGVIYGYVPEGERIVAFRVLQSRETPGLGDRVESDPGFQANFDNLDVRLNESKDDVANAIAFVPHGAKESPWQIDGLSGATVTSRAIADIVSQSTRYWIPRIVARIDDFRRPQGGGET